MRKSIIIVAILGVILSGAALAADREQYHITELTLGDPAVKLTATASEINAVADVSARQTTASLTNGAALTLSASTPVVILTGTGGANDTTNTFTLTSPWPAGVEFTLVAAVGTTNLLLLADATTTVSLGSSWLADETDSLKFYTVSTTALSKTGGSDN